MVAYPTKGLLFLAADVREIPRSLIYVYHPIFRVVVPLISACFDAILLFDPPLMKKLLSVFCCILYFHSMAQSPLDIKVTSPKTSGEKMLIKALTAIANREGNKKVPFKRINPVSSEGPYL
jgi:hypothetical protein